MKFFLVGLGSVIFLLLAFVVVRGSMCMVRRRAAIYPMTLSDAQDRAMMKFETVLRSKLGRRPTDNELKGLAVMAFSLTEDVAIAIATGARSAIEMMHEFDRPFNAQEEIDRLKKALSDL